MVAAIILGLDFVCYVLVMGWMGILGLLFWTENSVLTEGMLAFLDFVCDFERIKGEMIFLSLISFNSKEKINKGTRE